MNRNNIYIICIIIVLLLILTIIFIYIHEKYKYNNNNVKTGIMNQVIKNIEYQNNNSNLSTIHNSSSITDSNLDIIDSNLDVTDNNLSIINNNGFMTQNNKLKINDMNSIKNEFLNKYTSGNTSISPNVMYNYMNNNTNILNTNMMNSYISENTTLNTNMMNSYVSYKNRAGQINNDFKNRILNEINMVRTNPIKYADEMENYIKGKEIFYGRNNSNINDINEALKYLRNVAKREPIKYNSNIDIIAQKLVNTQGPTGSLGHGDFIKRMGEYGTYRQVVENISYGLTDPKDIVIQWIIDTGVPDRGHRKNIFEPIVNEIGIGYGPHKNYRNMAVVVLMKDYRLK